MRTFERRPRYGLQPQLAAGDLPIFTEALIHGSMPWAAARERRALLYKLWRDNQGENVATIKMRMPRRLTAL